MEFIASPATRHQIDSLLKQPPHAVCIFAPSGSGKKYTAQYIACQILKTDSPTPAQLYIVRPNEKGVITIEQAREMLKFTKLKSHGRKSINRVIVIEDAHLMTPESQNALLKIIEEPPTDTVLLLTAPNSSSLLKTINSRVATLTINPVAKEDARKLYQHIPETDFNKAWLLSSGRLGLLNAILTDSENELLDYITTAKAILQASLQERLAKVDQIQKTSIPDFLEALLIVAKAGRAQASLKNVPSQTKKWQSITECVLDTQETLQYNPNQKLLLTNLMLEL
jgi:DNA polymerase III delta prime subunit